MSDPNAAQADPTPTDKQSLPQHLRTTAVDVSNEALVQSANLFLVARRVLLTSLGALAMTIDESADFVNKLVERGEVAESDLNRLVSEYVERSNEREEVAAIARRDTVDKATVALADSVEVILGRLNVPTRTDIDDLSRKIGQLSDKVLTLKQRTATSQHSADNGAVPADAKSAPAQDAVSKRNGVV
jgi:poly(hydroxyalkanoate) granule-associated protein